jgi:hypothetical protein
LKGVVIAVLNVFGMDRNLMICPHEIHFRKVGATGKVVGVVLYVWDSVGDSASVKGFVISTWPSTAILLEHKMEGG